VAIQNIYKPPQYPAACYSIRQRRTKIIEAGVFASHFSDKSKSLSCMAVRLYIIKSSVCGAELNSQLIEAPTPADCEHAFHAINKKLTKLPNHVFGRQKQL